VDEDGFNWVLGACVTQKNEQWTSGRKPCGRLKQFLETIFNIISGAQKTRAFVLLLDTEENVNIEPLRGLRVSTEEIIKFTSINLNKTRDTSFKDHRKRRNSNLDASLPPTAAKKARTDDNREQNVGRDQSPQLHTSTFHELNATLQVSHLPLLLPWSHTYLLTPCIYRVYVSVHVPQDHMLQQYIYIHIYIHILLHIYTYFVTLHNKDSRQHQQGFGRKSRPLKLPTSVWKRPATTLSRRRPILV